MSPSIHRRRWLLLAPLGLAVIGFGVCLVAEAAMLKYSGAPWFWPGTASLIVLNTGVCLVGGAVREEVLWRLAARETTDQSPAPPEPPSGNVRRG